MSIPIRLSLKPSAIFELIDGFLARRWVQASVFVLALVYFWLLRPGTAHAGGLFTGP